MTRSKSHKNDEDLLGIIRNQKSEIKRLKRRIRSLEKQTLLIEPDEEELAEFRPTSKKCSRCDQFTVETVVLTSVNRKFERCVNCGLRGPAKKTD